MPIIAVTIVTARQHENAELLRVYQVEAPGVDPTQIIANNETIYEIGDVAAAALEGTVLNDGTAIVRRKIRGIVSLGMLMGKVQDAPGTTLTAKLGATDAEKPDHSDQGVVEDSGWTKYTSIDGYLGIREEILAVPDVIVAEKLDGSSCRFGFRGARKYLVGTHIARIVDERMDPASWPKDTFPERMLTWAANIGMQARIAKFQAAHPMVKQLSIFGEVVGHKCSDTLHYGMSTTEVRLFGDVAVDGRFLNYDDALDLLAEVFPEEPLSNRLVPILYRGKPDAAVFKRLRDQMSTFAQVRGLTKQVSEGIIIRPTAESISKVTLNRLIAKYKGPLYEERKSLRGRDTGKLPVYLTVYDLLFDFITDERIRHVLRDAEAAGLQVSRENMRNYGQLLYADIRKESVTEWPAACDMKDDVLVRWTFNIAKDDLLRIVNAWGKPA